jgi:membrane protein DedA with SNARE-associated domain
MDAALAWLVGLPPAALYLALAVTAAIENFFPPFPADTVVAFGSFLAARGEATLAGTFLSTWLGNVGGAATVYALGRRYGAADMQRRLLKYGGRRTLRKVQRLYRRRGLVALFLSRFLPGARALVPPFAGALRMPPGPAITVIAIASALWYGAITIAAYRVGTDWDTLRRLITRLSRDTALVALALAILVGGVWWFLHRRGRRTRP